MDMDAAKVLAIHERISVRMKKRAVEAARGPADLNPMLFITYSDGSHYVGKPIESQMGPDFALPRALAMDIFAHWVEKKQSIERIVIVMDAYVQRHEYEDEEAIRDIRRGDLGKDFRTNPNSNVTEGMVTSAAWLDDDEVCHARTVTQGYRFTDGGVLAWDTINEGDEMIIDPDTNGKYGQVLDAAAVILHVTRTEDD